MRSDVRIRPATHADQAFVEEVAGRLASFTPPEWRTEKEIVDAERRTLRAFFAHPEPEAALLIAEIGAPLGFAYLEPLTDYFTGERHAHLGIIAVRDQAEGQGVGRALLEAAASWARERGFRRLTLNVFAGNARARGVYERAGFLPETLRYVRAI